MQRRAARETVSVDRSTEQLVERPITQPTPVKTQWVKSIEALERQRSLATTNTTNDAASERSAIEIQRTEPVIPSLPKISIMSVIFKPKQTNIDAVDLEKGQAKVEINKPKKTDSSMRRQMETRTWQAAAAGQWTF